MPEKEINGFKFNEDDDIEKILSDHYKFAKRGILDQEESKRKDLIEQERNKWVQEQANNSFLDSIGDEKKKGLAQKLIKAGSSVDEIKKEYGDLFGQQQETKQEPETKQGVSIEKVFQFMESGAGVQDQEINKILNKPIAQLTPDEKTVRAEWMAQNRMKQ